MNITGHAGSIPYADQCRSIKINFQELILILMMNWSALRIDPACPDIKDSLLSCTGWTIGRTQNYCTDSVKYPVGTGILCPTDDPVSTRGKAIHELNSEQSLTRIWWFLHGSFVCSSRWEVQEIAFTLDLTEWSVGPKFLHWQGKKVIQSVQEFCALLMIQSVQEGRLFLDFLTSCTQMTCVKTIKIIHSLLHLMPSY